jgi:hypothetical protein
MFWEEEIISNGSATNDLPAYNSPDQGREASELALEPLK